MYELKVTEPVSLVPSRGRRVQGAASLPGGGVAAMDVVGCIMIDIPATTTRRKSERPPIIRRMSMSVVLLEDLLIAGLTRLLPDHSCHCRPRRQSSVVRVERQQQHSSSVD